MKTQKVTISEVPEENTEELDLKSLNEHTSKKKIFASSKLKFGDKQEKTQLGRSDLNAMLFKLKKYYNEINNLNRHKQKEVTIIKEKSENFEKKVSEIKSLNDIELKSEKISVKETTMFKESKEEIQKKIENLMEEKRFIEQKYKNEIEYKNTLTHLISSEKEKLQTLNDILTTNMEKLSSIKNFNFNLDINNKENKTKSKNFKNVLENLRKEKANLLEIMEYGKNELNILSDKIAIKEKTAKEMKRAIDKQNEILENELKIEKEKILKEIKESEELKKNKLEKETEYLKLILGLDLIKRYFIDVEKDGKEINYNDLLTSNEYKIFTSKIFHLSDEPEKISNEKSNNINSYTENEFYFKRKLSEPKWNSNAKLNNEDQNDKTNENKQSEVNFYSTSMCGFQPFNKNFQLGTSKIFLSDIKEKFDNLEVDYETLMSIYSKIIYKTNFYHTNIINLNMKIINLESKKDKYTGQVKEIMKYNYKNFYDLVKNNSRFQNFMMGYKKEIQLQKNNQLESKFRNDLENILNDDSFFFDYRSQYEKLSNFMSIIKAFMQIVNTHFKLMHKENGVIKEDKNFKAFFKLGIKTRAEMRAIRHKLEEGIKMFEKFFGAGKELAVTNQPESLLNPKIQIQNNNLLSINASKQNPLVRASTSLGFNQLGTPHCSKILSEGGMVDLLDLSQLGQAITNFPNLNNPTPAHRKSSMTEITYFRSSFNNFNSRTSVENAGNSNYLKKAEYLDYLFAFFEKEDSFVYELKQKMENIVNINFNDTREFINSSQVVKNNFLDINIQFEKILFYFFSNQETVISLLKQIKETELFLTDILNTSNLMQKKSKETVEEEILEKVILPKREIKVKEDLEENLFEKDLDENLTTRDSKKEEAKIASLQPMRRIKSVNQIKITAKEKDSMAQTHLGFGINSNQRIKNKLYMPFINQKDYNKKLNENISDIKKDTRNTAILNHYLNKKKIEINKIAKDFIIYDNPNINIESISNTTYNSYVKFLLSHNVIETNPLMVKKNEIAGISEKIKKIRRTIILASTSNN